MSGKNIKPLRFLGYSSSNGWTSILLLVFLALSPAANADDSNQGLVATLAGGTGSPVSFNHPAGIAVDGSGNIYLADSGNYLVRKIGQDGTVTTLAGSGREGSDDGSGSAASFSGDDGVAVDASGNIYVGDSSKIRKIRPDGAVTTLADLGPGDANGIAVDSVGNVYVSDYSGNVIRKVTPRGAVTILAGGGAGTDENGYAKPGSGDGTGKGASFDHPQGLAVDSSGNVYVADSDKGTMGMIRKITPKGVVTTLARSAPPHSPIPSVRVPRFLAVDSLGNVYATDLDRILKIGPKGAVAVLAGTLANANYSVDGTGTEATFREPKGIATDASGNLYVADSVYGLIRKITNNPSLGIQASSAASAAGSPSAAPAAAPNNLKPHGRIKGGCDPGYPSGITGTLRTKVYVMFMYNPEGDSQLTAERAAREIQQRLAQLAANNPNGPQFLFPEKGPYDLTFQLDLLARGKNSEGKAKAYWGRVNGIDGWGGWLFTAMDPAHEPDDAEMPDVLWDEAVNKWYGIIANGWKCN